jgi:hypothetical protein
VTRIRTLQRTLEDDLNIQNVVAVWIVIRRNIHLEDSYLLEIAAKDFGNDIGRLVRVFTAASLPEELLQSGRDHR